MRSAIASKVKGARFPEINTIDGFDFDFDPVRKKLKARYLALHDATFLDKGLNPPFIGTPGTGKTYLARALAWRTCQVNRRVVLVSAPRMRIPAMPNTYSSRSRTVIPVHAEHPFRRVTALVGWLHRRPGAGGQGRRGRRRVGRVSERIGDRRSPAALTGPRAARGDDGERSGAVIAVAGQRSALPGGGSAKTKALQLVDVRGARCERRRAGE